jgi:membrane protein HdeD
MEAAVQLVLEQRRTGWDALFGALTVVAGAVVLAHASLASTVSALFLGWMLLVAGVVLVGAAVLGWTDPTRRWNLAFGVLTGVLGAGFVANPTAALATLTWVAGSLLLLGGVLRLVLAFQPGTPTAVLLYGGTVSVVLGLLLLLAWPGSARWFLGAALGVQLLLDGASTMLVGRWRLRQLQAVAAEPADEPVDEAADAAADDAPAAEPAAER